ncbi:apolipoprotein N-acyltransferase [Mycobacterium frederiksbergense]|uniref:Apolipoprotein N-acyltransferase n=1 Tax=Mycolicibacterium frederiksbergense TaxID=117567 RepID=A0ABT6KZB7_9MYCO|nr:apolipoprotein N-acyltransferase [Mycolicibacterium frederiksbergense]MDH6195170.1 apolipoprotein N-acyltransferase [Mycolicibacterium frederiksbergense]
MAGDRPAKGRSDRIRPGETTEVIPAVEEDGLAELDELDDESFEDLDEDVTGEQVADNVPDDEDPEDRGYRLTAAGTPDRWSALTARASRFGRAVAARWAQLAAAIGGGLALCLSYPPTGWWWAAFAGLALLGWVLTLRSTTRAGGFGYGFLFGLAFYVPLLPWISGFVGAVPWLALATMEALFCGLFGLAVTVVGRMPGWPVWFAALWVAQEWLKSTVPFGGFPWGVVGFSQTNGPLLPIARWGGASLMSFAVALVGFSATLLALEIAHWWRHGHKPGFPAPAVMLPGLSITVVLLGTALLWPQVRHSATGAGDEQAVTVAAVQGNVPRLGLDFNAQRRAVLDNHVNETLRLAEDVRAGRAAQPMFVIWPENASDIDPLANADAAAQITAAANAIDAPILVGGVTTADGYTPDNPVATNTVIVWDPVHGPGERHDKKIIQPFGEYLPWRGFFRHLSAYADRAGYFVPGDGNGVVHAAGVPIGVTTCWEVIFDRAARESVLNGAQVLTVPSNNATFDENMSAQQLAFGKLRAVEHDRYVVVAATTGISAVIAPDGRELARTEFFQPAYLDNQIRLKSELTPATQWGPAVQVVLVTIGLGVLLVAILQNGGFVQRMLRRRTGEGPRR